VAVPTPTRTTFVISTLRHRSDPQRADGRQHDEDDRGGDRPGDQRAPADHQHRCGGEDQQRARHEQHRRGRRSHGEAASRSAAVAERVADGEPDGPDSDAQHHRDVGATAPQHDDGDDGDNQHGDAEDTAADRAAARQHQREGGDGDAERADPRPVEPDTEPIQPRRRRATLAVLWWMHRQFA
jgi:hypothetical protein